MRRWLWLLAGAAAVAFLSLDLPGPGGGAPPSSHARDFQELTGGLGMGDTAAIYWDFQTFDPRLAPDCTCTLWPVPAGFLFSPEHRLTVWDPPEILSAPPGRDGPAAMPATAPARDPR